MASKNSEWAIRFCVTRREKGEFAAGGGGGDSGDLGIELEGPGERAETSSSSARDLPPGCLVLLGEKWGLTWL